MSDIAVYVWLVQVRQAYAELAEVGGQFKDLKTMAEQRMGAAPSLRDKVCSVASKVITTGVAGLNWWQMCVKLHPRDTFRVENPVENNVDKEKSRDVKPARREV